MPSEERANPGRGDVEAAATRLRGLAWHTPLIQSAWLSDAVRADVRLKLEHVQTTGSFKVRGAVNALARLKERQPGASRVVTASAGNHGLAIAWAARHFGVRVRVHLPASAPQAKRRALTRLGAELIDAPTYDEAEARGREDAAASGLPYISPYSHPDVIAGAGTVALEMLEDEPDLQAIVAPLAGGGLLAGTAIIARSRPDGPASTVPGVLVVGAEAEASPVFTSSLAAGRIVRVHVGPTIADGLAGNIEPDSRTFALVRDLVDRVALVTESSIEIAMRGLVVHERLIVEGAAAVAVAALLQGGLDLAGLRVGVILTGRNIDAGVLRRVL